VAAVLARSTTGVVGQHPDGFDPCAYDAGSLRDLTGLTVHQVDLDHLFRAAEAAPEGEVEAARSRASQALGPLDQLDQGSLDHSLRIYCGLRDLAVTNNWTGLATRCWPECFTTYGAAACAPQAMLSEDGIPAGCEADAYGTVTSVVLRELAGEAPFVADLVDVDAEDDTAVFWHCGVAPLNMADPKAGAGPTVHSNRRKALLHEFPLKPGRITIARLSRSGGTHRLVIGGGQVLEVPLAFAGTAGVIRFDRKAASVLATIMAEGLEHHYGLVYGDYRAELRALAELWQLPIVDLDR
jgi:L-fucose isomerase-like protein